MLWVNKSCSRCLCTPLCSRIWPWERTPWRCCGARGRGVQLAPRSSSGGRETAPEALAGCYFHHSFSPMKRCSFFFLFPQGIFISLRVSRERFVRNNLLDPSRIISSGAWGRDAEMYLGWLEISLGQSPGSWRGREGAGDADSKHGSRALLCPPPALPGNKLLGTKLRLCARLYRGGLCGDLQSYFRKAIPAPMRCLTPRRTKKIV